MADDRVAIVLISLTMRPGNEATSSTDSAYGSRMRDLTGLGDEMPNVQALRRSSALSNSR